MTTDFVIWVSAGAATLIAVVAVINVGRSIYRSRVEKAEKKAEWKGRTDESVINLKTTLANI